MTHSETIDQIATALAKAQGAIKCAAKDSANPFFKSKYADLASVWDACRGPLSENGLAVVQTPSADGERIVITTLLTHTSGQWIKDTLPLMPKEDSPQAIGSVITYGRRYALAAFAGVAPEGDDDDAEAGEGRKDGKPQAVAGKCYVKSVKADPTTNPRITRYTVTFSDGRKGSTIKDEIGMAAKRQEAMAEMDRPLVEAIITRGKFGMDIIEFNTIADQSPVEAPF